MSKYKDVIWYCDKCNAILNGQDGFHDDCGAWLCTECGYANEINQNNIFDSKEDYLTSCNSSAINMDQNIFHDDCQKLNYTEIENSNEITDDSEQQYYCPNCYSIINSQYNFDLNSDCHTCTCCNTELRKENGKYIVICKCPKCGSILNDQFGFFDDRDEFICRNCKAELYKEGNEYKNSNICPNCGSLLDDQIEYCHDLDYVCQNCYKRIEKIGNKYELYDDVESKISEASHYYDSKSNWSSSGDRYNHGIKYSASKDKEFNFKKFKLKVIIFTFIFFSLAIGFFAYECKLGIEVGYSSDSLINLNYEDVANKLKDSGFLYVSVNEISDLKIGEIAKEYKVSDIAIGNRTSFDAETKLPSNFPVKITYHTLATLSVPLSSKEFKELDYKEATKILKEAGFIDVETYVKYDLIFGWLNKDGQVESIMIGDTNKFSTDDQFRPDEKIIITYHTYRKDQPE